MIKYMHKRCVPGSLSPPPRKPGYKATVKVTITVIASTGYGIELLCSVWLMNVAISTGHVE